jgi:cytochrome c5
VPPSCARASESRACATELCACATELCACAPELRARPRARDGYFVIRRPALYYNKPLGGFPVDFQRVTVANNESSDRHFFNSFSLVLGCLIAFAVVLFVVARLIGVASQSKNVLVDPMRVKDVERNLAPFAHVAVAGHDNSALNIAPASSAPAADVPTTGEQAFTKVCSACHAQGINGAPKMGDHAAWGPRIAQGKDALYAHVIAGKGNMPPRAGTTWPDATIHMAVDYMVSLNK